MELSELIEIQKVTDQEQRFLELLRSFQYGELILKNPEGKIAILKEAGKIVDASIQFKLKI